MRLRDVPVRLWHARIGVLAVVATVAVGCSVKPDQIGTEPSMSPGGAGIEQKPVAPATYDSMNRAAYLKPVGHNSSAPTSSAIAARAVRETF